MKEKIWNFAVLIICPIWCYYSSFSWLKCLMGTLHRNIWHIDSLKSWMSQLLRPLKSTLILILYTLFFLMEMHVKQLPVKKNPVEGNFIIHWITQQILMYSKGSFRMFMQRSVRKPSNFVGLFLQLFFNLLIGIGWIILIHFSNICLCS